MCGVDVKQVWRQSSVLGHSSQGVGLAVGALTTHALTCTLCYFQLLLLTTRVLPIVSAPTCHSQVQVQGPFASREGDGPAQQGVFYNVRENS